MSALKSISFTRFVCETIAAKTDQNESFLNFFLPPKIDCVGLIAQRCRLLCRKRCGTPTGAPAEAPDHMRILAGAAVCVSGRGWLWAVPLFCCV